MEWNRRLEAVNVILDYWEGRLAQKEATISLKSYDSIRASSAVAKATTHKARWPEKLSDYWASKIIDENTVEVSVGQER